MLGVGGPGHAVDARALWAWSASLRRIGAASVADLRRARVTGRELDGVDGGDRPVRDRHLDLDRSEARVDHGTRPRYRRPGARRGRWRRRRRVGRLRGSSRPVRCLGGRRRSTRRGGDRRPRSTRRRLPRPGSSGVLKLNSRASARPVPATATSARFGTSSPRSVPEPLGVDLVRREPRGGGASAGRRPSSDGSAQEDIALDDVGHELGERRRPERPTGMPTCLVRRPGNGPSRR